MANSYYIACYISRKMLKIDRSQIYCVRQQNIQENHYIKKRQVPFSIQEFSNTSPPDSTLGIDGKIDQLGSGNNVNERNHPPMT